MPDIAASLKVPAKHQNETNLSEDTELLRHTATVAAEGAVLAPEQPAKEDTTMGPDRVPEDASVSTLKSKAVGRDGSFASYPAQEQHEQGVAESMQISFMCNVWI